MKIKEVTKVLLSSACEDSFGLHEAIWELNSKFPNEALGEKYNAAASALLDLVKHGWIRLERVRSGREPEVILPEMVEDVLSSPVSWYPEYQGSSICFAATELGRRIYFETSA